MINQIALANKKTALSSNAQYRYSLIQINTAHYYAIKNYVKNNSY